MPEDKKSKPRRRGQIIKWGPDRWLISVFLGRDGQGKKRYSTKMVRGTRKDAETQLTSVLRGYGLGNIVETTTETLGSYLDRWLDSAAKLRLAPRTFYDYTEILARYVRPELGSKKLASIRALNLQSLYSKMLKAGLSSRTVRQTQTVLSSAFKQAVKRGSDNERSEAGGLLWKAADLPLTDRGENRKGSENLADPLTPLYIANIQNWEAGIRTQPVLLSLYRS